MSKLPDKTSSDQATVSAAHFFRAVHSHQVMLNALADRKANFLLGATFLTLSIILASGLKEMTMTISVVIIFSLVVASLAILAIIPKVNTDTSEPQGSLFFFGTFAERSFEDFFSDVQSELKSIDSIHEHFARDIYVIGKILLKRKYFYLTWAYRLFLVGLIATPICFLIEKCLS